MSCNTGFTLIGTTTTCTSGILTSTQTCSIPCISSTDSLFTSLYRQYDMDDSIGSTSLYEGITGNTQAQTSSSGVTFGVTGVVGNGVTLSGSGNQAGYIYIPSSALPTSNTATSFTWVCSKGEKEEEEKLNKIKLIYKHIVSYHCIVVLYSCFYAFF
jgi:hypothetical protein